MIAAYDQTAKAYHGKYGDQFGDENNSFVCQQANIEKILKCLFMGDSQNLNNVRLQMVIPLMGHKLPLPRSCFRLQNV